MSIDRIERYSIERCADGVAVSMRNRGSAAGIAALSILAILWSGWHGPYGPHPVPEWSSMYWIFTGFFSLTLAAALVSAMHRW